MDVEYYVVSPFRANYKVVYFKEAYRERIIYPSGLVYNRAATGDFSLLRELLYLDFSSSLLNDPYSMPICKAYLAHIIDHLLQFCKNNRILSALELP